MELSNNSKQKPDRSESSLTKSLNNKRRKIAFGLAFGFGSSVMALSLFWYKLQSSIPDSVASVTTYVRPNTLTIKAANGSIVKQIGAVSHEKIKLEKLNPIIYQAFIASEDKRFYEHDGIDVKGIARAMVANIKTGEATEGASTITQQLARIVYLNQEKRVWRKLKEIQIARRIEENLSKEQILETYLNLVYLGSGSYGIADAAWVYFGKTPEQLTLNEAATIAGIAPAPSIYSPFANPEKTKQQRNIVLNKMAASGYISTEEATKVISESIITNRKKPKRLQRTAQYFAEYIEKELVKYIPEEKLQEGGIVVETTIDLEWQKAAEKTIDYGLNKYGKWQKFAQGSLVAIDPRTGGIKAMVGGKDFGDNQYNRVTQAQRQPGSTFKTFVYTAAIAAGFSPYKYYLDAEFYVDGYKPRNYEDKYQEENVSLYKALMYSTNTVALQTMIDVGWNPTINVAQKMGIKSELKPTYSLALGSWEVNLLELTSAYGTLANRGVYQEAFGITKVSDPEGEIIYERKLSPVKAMEEDTAAIMNWMLRGVVYSGTGIPAQIGRPSAGKTGTSDESRDLWYVGYIPQITAGIWLGNDDNKPTLGTSGIAAEMWRNFMLQIVKDIPVEQFPPRPPLTGRNLTVATEPLKPKRKYHIRKPKRKKIRRARYAKRRTRSRYQPRRKRYYTPQRKTRRTPVRKRITPPSRTVQRKYNKPPKPSQAPRGLPSNKVIRERIRNTPLPSR